MRTSVLFILGIILLSGCYTKPGTAVVPPVNYVSDARLKQGLVIVLTGVEGRSKLNEAICEGLNDGGVTWAIELEDWTTQMPLNYLVNLRNESRNREQAELIADRIIRYKMAYPGKAVVLVGQSGGGGMAAWVVEALPPQERVDGVIMLAASLSPQYPLDATLAKSSRGVVNFYSDRDWFILGVGTTISGTMDGEHTSSAGRVGFEMPTSGPSSKLYYQKLFEVAWQPAMAETGYDGRHITSGARNFVATYVAPLVLEKRWTRELVMRLTTRKPTEVAELATGRGFRPDTRPTTKPTATKPVGISAFTKPSTWPTATKITDRQPMTRPARIWTAPTATGQKKPVISTTQSSKDQQPRRQPPKSEPNKPETPAKTPPALVPVENPPVDFSRPDFGS